MEFVSRNIGRGKEFCVDVEGRRCVEVHEKSRKGAGSGRHVHTRVHQTTVHAGGRGREGWRDGGRENNARFKQLKLCSRFPHPLLRLQTF